MKKILVINWKKKFKEVKLKMEEKSKVINFYYFIIMPSIMTRDVLFSSMEETGIVSSPQEWRAGNAVKKSKRRGNSFFIIGRLLSGHDRDCTKNTSLSPKKKENPYNFS